MARNVESDDAVSGLARHYDAAADWGGVRDEPNRERIARTLDVIPNDVASVLDVGCGDGAVSNDLAARGIPVVGLDISPSALAFLEGVPVLGGVAALPFADRAFDLVMALEVVEHLPEGVFEAALGELTRVSRRYAVVSTPNAEHLPSGLARCDRCGATFHRNLHMRSLDAAGHARLLRAHGFVCRQTIGVSDWRQSAAWTRTRQAVGGRSALRPVRTCPRCGAPGGPAPAPGPPTRAMLRVTDAIGWRLVRPIPRWLVTLYERTDAQPDEAPPSPLPVSAV